VVTLPPKEKKEKNENYDDSTNRPAEETTMKKTTYERDSLERLNAQVLKQIVRHSPTPLEPELPPATRKRKRVRPGPKPPARDSRKA
jgi:hypothetical protein